MTRPQDRLPRSHGNRLLLFLLLSLASCGGGGGGGGGIPAVTTENEVPANDTPAGANVLSVGTPIRGEVGTAGDVDCYAIALGAGSVVQFELFATRTDQSTWDANVNIPRLTILDTDANGNAKLLEQDFSGNFSDGWNFGFEDLDIPLFEVPATGTYYAVVTQDNDAAGGGAYILRASYVSLSGLQEEAEQSGTTGANDTFDTAQAITPGTIHGYHVADELDYYSFSVSTPTVVRFELSAYRNGVHDDSGLYYDPSVHLYDSDGTTELAFNDDAYFYDSGIQYEIDTAGTYYFSVDQIGPGMSGEYFLGFSTSTGLGTLEAEPNDDAAGANPIAYGARSRGTIDAGASDFFQFTGVAGDMLRLQYFDGGNKQDATDSPSFALLGTDGATNLACGGGDSLHTLSTILQESGTFYVRVEGGTASTPYAIELTRFASSTYETEPNNTLAEAAALSERVSGVIDSGIDLDTYRVSLSQDRLARFVCYASSAYTDADADFNYSGHGSDLAPRIELVDGTGAVLASSTSAPANSSYTESVTQPLPTCGLVWAPPASGTYYVRISDANGGSGASFYYVLEYEQQ